MYDTLVIGAGPAGGSAAVVAAELGLSVALVDEQRGPGGQVWRAKSAAIIESRATPESRAGDKLRQDISASGISTYFSKRVWQIQPGKGGWKIYIASAETTEVLYARTLVVATGAQERVIPIEGWTLPGVIGLAAATAMMKEHKILPGHRVVVSGCGPLLPFVAHEIVAAGGEVAAIADLNSFGDWIRLAPALMRRPDLALRGKNCQSEQHLCF